MEDPVMRDIEKLRRASLAVLRERYRAVFEEEPRSTHRHQMFRRIAWRLQALAEGDLSDRARRRGQELARDADLRRIAPGDFFTGAVEGVRVPGRAERLRRDSRL